MMPQSRGSPGEVVGTGPWPRFGWPGDKPRALRRPEVGSRRPCGKWPGRIYESRQVQEPKSGAWYRQERVGPNQVQQRITDVIGKMLDVTFQTE